LLGSGLFSYWTWTLVTPPSFQALTPPFFPSTPSPSFLPPSPSCLVLSPACLSRGRQTQAQAQASTFPSTFDLSPSTLHPPSLLRLHLYCTYCNCIALHCSSRATVYFLLHMPCFTLNAPRNLPASISPVPAPNPKSALLCSFFSSLSLLSLLDIFHPTSPYRTSNITRNRPRTCYPSVRIHDACYSVHGGPSSASSWSSSCSCRSRVN
jgi:hypothetical protein